MYGVCVAAEAVEPPRPTESVPLDEIKDLIAERLGR
jgi:hypothetical protein